MRLFYSVFVAAAIVASLAVTIISPIIYAAIYDFWWGFLAWAFIPVQLAGLNYMIQEIDKDAKK